MNEARQVRSPVRLSLTVSEDLLPRFCLLTGSGFIVRAAAGCSVHDLLCGPLGIAGDYLEQRIQTIFLNGTVVDDPRAATVPADSTIALSAAMPGIAGIMLRKGSPYASMRSQISHAGRDAGRAADGRSRLVIKLFNMVQVELGPAMLRRGVQIPGKALADLFRGRSKAFFPGVLAARIDDAPMEPRAVFETNWTDQEVLLHLGS